MYGIHRIPTLVSLSEEEILLLRLDIIRPKDIHLPIQQEQMIRTLLRPKEANLEKFLSDLKENVETEYLEIRERKILALKCYGNRIQNVIKDMSQGQIRKSIRKTAIHYLTFEGMKPEYNPFTRLFLDVENKNVIWDTLVNDDLVGKTGSTYHMMNLAEVFDIDGLELYKGVFNLFKIIGDIFQNLGFSVRVVEITDTDISSSSSMLYYGVRICNLLETFHDNRIQYRFYIMPPTKPCSEICQKHLNTYISSLNNYLYENVVGEMLKTCLPDKLVDIIEAYTQRMVEDLIRPEHVLTRRSFIPPLATLFL